MAVQRRQRHRGRLDRAGMCRLRRGPPRLGRRRHAGAHGHDGHCAQARARARTRRSLLHRAGCRRNVGLDLHHRAVHSGKLVIRGAAPDGVTFEFRKPRDRRNVTDDDDPALPTSRASSATRTPTPAAPRCVPRGHPRLSRHPATRGRGDEGGARRHHAVRRPDVATAAAQFGRAGWFAAFSRYVRMRSSRSPSRTPSTSLVLTSVR